MELVEVHVIGSERFQRGVQLPEDLVRRPELIALEVAEVAVPELGGDEPLVAAASATKALSEPSAARRRSSRIRSARSELDVVTEVDYQLRRHGSLGPSFTTSLYCSGPDHPLLFGRRQETWKRVLTPPVSILFDFGAILDGYCYDFGRTVFFGDPDDAYLEVFGLVMKAQDVGVAALRAGQATAADVDRAARDVLEEAGYGEAFRHRLGHAIGLDVHEPPFLTASDRTMVQEGMLFTVEPSITRFETFSARVEDVVVARPDGGELLTTGFRDVLVVP